MERSEKIQIRLEPVEYRALAKWANGEIRGLEQQVRYILRQELARRGLLVIETQADPALVTALPAENKQEQGSSNATH